MHLLLMSVQLVLSRKAPPFIVITSCNFTDPLDVEMDRLNMAIQVTRACELLVTSTPETEVYYW